MNSEAESLLESFCQSQTLGVCACEQLVGKWNLFRIVSREKADLDPQPHDHLSNTVQNV